MLIAMTAICSAGIYIDKTTAVRAFFAGLLAYSAALAYLLPVA